jgi:hypothetical protein
VLALEERLATKCRPRPAVERCDGSHQLTAFGPGVATALGPFSYTQVAPTMLRSCKTQRGTFCILSSTGTFTESPIDPRCAQRSAGVADNP